jgi:tetratricopeptide (TPR) repeat protein
MDEALKLMDTIIALQPDSARNWIMKTEALMQAGRYTEALQSSERAIQIATSTDPHQASMAWYMNAYALAKNNRYDEALISCNKGIGLSDDDSYEGIYNRACIYSLKGDKKKALADLKLAIEKDPTARDQVKARARADGDFKSLYTDEDFKELTRPEYKLDADNAGAMDSVCSISEKKYSDTEYSQKVSGSWKAVRIYVHGQNALGTRNFFFRLNSDGTIEIEEPERNYLIKGTWKIGQEENTISWEMPDKNNSFEGKYDFLEKDLVLSGRGFIGVMENVCIRLVVN